MKADLRNKYLSHARYNRYLVATSGRIVSANRLYFANMRLAQAFHPILSQFEVVVRNSLNNVMASNFSDPEWVLNQRNGFMRDASLSFSNFFLRNSIAKSERKLKTRGIPITAGKIIADQTFGFWVSLFLPHHYSLISGCPIHAFPAKPAQENRASIHSKLEEIKDFRNRVNHCEPLCFSGLTIDCSQALKIRADLYRLLNWIDPALPPFFSKFDRVPIQCQRIESI